MHGVKVGIYYSTKHSEKGQNGSWETSHFWEDVYHGVNISNMLEFLIVYEEVKAKNDFILCLDESFSTVLGDCLGFDV